MAGKRRGFGGIRRLPSKRWQAYYSGPDGLRHTAPTTFTAKIDAEGWLASERRLIERDEWRPPAARRAPVRGATLRSYAPGALDRRRVRGEPLRPRTLALYRGLLDRLILPELGDLPLAGITPEAVRVWYDGLDAGTPTQRGHAYALLSTLMNQAVAEGLVRSNPCTVRGGGATGRRHEVRVATPAEVAAIAGAMPPRLALLPMLAAWCSLRYGELTELRRRDVDLERGTLRVDRAVVRVGGEYIVGPPKSAAGRRTVAIPPHVLPAVEAHLVGLRRDALLFAAAGGGHLSAREVGKAFDRARRTAGRPDLRLHDLRHTGATWAAQTGATLAELMARVGHSSPGMALRYQHAAAGRDAAIAEAMSKLARP